MPAVQPLKSATTPATPQPAMPATAPACAYLLADHLDATLAAGEDIVKLSFSRQAGEKLSPETIAAARAEQRSLVERIRTLELSIVMRLLKARERATELANGDSRFALVSKLFIGGTAPLVDAVAECGDASAIDFETGDAFTTYLRSRALIGARSCIVREDDPIRVDEQMLIAGRIELGALLDLVAAFIDALELHFVLYAEDGTPDDADAAASAA